MLTVPFPRLAFHSTDFLTPGFTLRSSLATPPSCCSSRACARRTAATTAAKASTPTMNRWRRKSASRPSVSGFKTCFFHKNVRAKERNVFSCKTFVRYETYFHDKIGTKERNLLKSKTSFFSRHHLGRCPHGAERGDPRELQDPLRRQGLPAGHHRLAQGQPHPLHG